MVSTRRSGRTWMGRSRSGRRGRRRAEEAGGTNILATDIRIRMFEGSTWDKNGRLEFGTHSPLLDAIILFRGIWLSRNERSRGQTWFCSRRIVVWSFLCLRLTAGVFANSVVVGVTSKSHLRASVMPLGQSLSMLEEDVEGTEIEKTSLLSVSIPKAQRPMPFAANLSLTLIMAIPVIILGGMIILVSAGLVHRLVVDGGRYSGSGRT